MIERPQWTGTRVLVALVLALFAISACRDHSGSPPPTQGELVEREPTEQSKSPSAKIFPEPLEPGAPADADASNAPAAVVQPGKRSSALQPLPLQGPLEVESMGEGEGTGLSIEMTMSFPPAKSSVIVEGISEQVWPNFRFDVLGESTKYPARLRIVFSSGPLPLPPGSELRASVDREGWLVVWPDGRSYRALPDGALRAMLEERRVDRAPVVPAKASDAGVGEVLGRKTKRLALSSAMGTLVLDFLSAPELGPGAVPPCAFFVALLRADPRAHCSAGLVPIAARYTWGKDASLEFVAKRLTTRADLRVDSFSMPPPLGIFKPGELPPMGAALAEVLDASSASGLTFLKAAPAVAIVLPGSKGAATFSNHHDVPLYLLIDGLPLFRLDQRSTTSVSWTSGPHRHAARDFLGKLVLGGGTLSEAGEVAYGTAQALDAE